MLNRMPQIHFLGGMPRAGSTLLANILHQNPKFNATATSGILDVLVSLRNGWSNIDSFRAHPNEDGKRRVLKGVLDAYYAHCAGTVFDKSRGWLQYLEMSEMILGRKAKVIVPVRDVREILSSFERIYRKHAATDALPQEKADPIAWQTLEGRIKMWAGPTSPVGSAYNRIKDAIQRGFRDRMLFVHYEELTASPSVVLSRIYNFLSETPFAHDFVNVRQVTVEDDTMYGFPQDSLHTIRPVVQPQEQTWPTILGDLGESLATYNNLWKNA